MHCYCTHLISLLHILTKLCMSVSPWNVNLGMLQQFEKTTGNNNIEPIPLMWVSAVWELVICGSPGGCAGVERSYG